MKAAAIRRELRTADTDEMDQRRKVIALSAAGLLDFSLISLYQTGVIKRLPDLPWRIFDSNKVNKSKDAYMMGVPDGPVSAMVYALTMTLAAAGGSEQSGRKPVWDVLLGTSIIGNAVGGAYYMHNMIFKQKKICLYCVAGALINFASAVIIAPTVWKSFRKLLGRNRR